MAASGGAFGGLFGGGAALPVSSATGYSTGAGGTIAGSLFKL